MPSNNLNYNPDRLQEFLLEKDLSVEMTKAVPDAKEQVPQARFKIGEEIYLPLSFDEEHDTTDNNNREYKEIARRGYKKFIVEGTEHGNVTISSAFNSDRTVTLDEGELLTVKLDSQRKNLKPLGEFYGSFNIKKEFKVDELIKWKKKWVDSGEIDTFRKQHGNITISDERIEQARKMMDLYVEILQTPGIDGSLVQEAENNLGLQAGILTGVHNPESNDIEHLITLDQASRIQLLQDVLNEAKNGTTTAVVASSPIVAPAAAPGATVVPIERGAQLKRIRDAWPRNIYFIQNQKDGRGKGGWVRINDKGETETLPTGEWTSAHENIKPILDAGVKFLLEGNAGMRIRKEALYEPLIAVKSDVVDALNNKDLDAARTAAALLATMINEAEEDWIQYIEKEKDRRKYEEEKEVMLGTLSDADITKLEKEVEDAKTLIDEGLRTEFLTKSLGKVTEMFTKLKASLAPNQNAFTIHELREAKQHFETELKRFKDTLAKERNTLEKVASTKGGPILRPLRVTKDVKGNILERRDGTKVVMDDAFAEKLKNEEAVKRTAETLQKADDAYETLEKYEDMYAGNPREFIEMYTYRRVSPGPHQTLLVLNDKALNSPHKTFIQKMFADNGIPVSVPDEIDRMKKVHAETEERKLAQVDTSAFKHTSAYTPGKDSYSWNVHKAQNKQKPIPFMPKMEAEKNAYPKEGTNVVDGKEVTYTGPEAEALKPKMQLESKHYQMEGMSQKLKMEKTSALLKSRMGNLMKDARLHVKNNKLFWGTVATAIISISAIYKHLDDQREQERKLDNQPVAEAVTEAATETPKKPTGWRAFMNYGNKQEMTMIEDVKTLDPDALIKKYVPIEQGSNLLERLKTDKAITNGKIFGREGIQNLDDTTREKLYDLLMFLTKISTSIDAPGQNATLGTSTTFLPAQDRYITGDQTVQQYIQIIKAKINNADAQ